MTKNQLLRHPATAVRAPVIAMTMGDPGGIGPEVVVKCLNWLKRNPRCRYVVIGSQPVFSFLNKKTHLDFSFKRFPSNGHVLQKGRVYFWDIGDGKFDRSQETIANGQMAIRAISIASDLAKEGGFQAIVTAPINKASARLAQKGFIGHTEFFAQAAAAKHYAMMFVGSSLKLTLVTIHVPLKRVSHLLSSDLIFEKIILTAGALKKDFKIKNPKIAVCAFNPHGKECGGREEVSIISPAIRRAQRKGMLVSGPYPADQIFYFARCGAFDALIAMYHDQALGPFKMVHFHDGVNVTLGLPYVRTSPDHGTAYDIAYQGKADPSSMMAALKLAETLALNRS